MIAQNPTRKVCAPRVEYEMKPRVGFGKNRETSDSPASISSLRYERASCCASVWGNKERRFNLEQGDLLTTNTRPCYRGSFCLFVFFLESASNALIRGLKR